MRIKWENIAFMLGLIYGGYCIYTHYGLEFNNLTLIEVIIYFGMALSFRLSIKYIRLNKKEIMKSIKNLIFE